MTNEDVAGPDEPALLAGIRSICLGLPEATERLSHGTPTFFVKGKTFVYAWLDGHHDHAFAHLWCAAAPGVQDALVTSSPSRYFRPPYVGHRGWIGMRLDGVVDWDEIAEACEDGYRAVAPKRLVTELDAAPPSTPRSPDDPRHR